MNAISKVTARRSLFEEWTIARPHLLPAMHTLRGAWEEDDIHAALLAGQMLLWLGEGCAAITQIVQYPRKRALNVFLAGGNMDGLLALDERFESHARDQGCDKTMITGRKGWERVRPDYTVEAVIISKDL